MKSMASGRVLSQSLEPHYLRGGEFWQTIANKPLPVDLFSSGKER